MKHGLMFSSSLVAAIIAVAAVPRAQQDITARARAIHDRVIALDTHNDIDPQNFTASCNYTMRLTTQVNLPKMKEIRRRPVTTTPTAPRSPSSTPSIG